VRRKQRLRGNAAREPSPFVMAGHNESPTLCLAIVLRVLYSTEEYGRSADFQSNITLS
jgi:hypothetical protein